MLTISACCRHRAWGQERPLLTEAMLFVSGAVDRLGSVDNGTSTTDFEPEEIARKITISSAPAFCNWNNNRINIIDTRFINFIEDTRLSQGC